MVTLERFFKTENQKFRNFCSKCNRRISIEKVVVRSNQPVCPKCSTPLKFKS